jgi:uncharacterized protein (TIGR02302 family)
MTPPGPALRRKRAAARLVLWFERFWPAVWPALGVLGAYACAALLDIPGLLPPWPRVLLLTAALGLAAWLLWRGLRQVRLPSEAEADRRLERASGLRHRPLSALADLPAAPSDESSALWQVHLARLAAQVRRLRVGRPRPGLAARDGRALRGAMLLGLVAAWVMAGPDAGLRLARGFWPALPAGAAVPGTVVQAWFTPPGYSGLPPVFLHPDSKAVTVPTGSHLVVSVTGGSGAPSLALDGAAEPFHALDGASWQAERDLTTGGQLSVQRRGGDLASWALTVLPDHPPTAAFTDAPGPALSGGRPTQQTRMAWRVEDDYGVADAHVELHLRDRPQAPPVLLPITLAGAPKRAQGVHLQDLTAHPWAGLPVVARLVARDAPGQFGQSPDAEFILPERPFQNAMARAILAVRRQLSLTPEERQQARTALDALADAPDNPDATTGAVLNLRATGFLLSRGRGTAAVDEAQSRMWDLALALEEGAADRTARALEAARQAVRDAVDANRDTPEDRAEIDRRMQELREAIQRHLEALAEQARRDGTELPYDPSAPQMNSRDLDRMAEQMRDAAREGRMDDARKQMAELEKLLDQLQNARPEHGEAQEKQNAERRQRGRQQMDAVQDMVRREGTMLDRSQARAGAEPPRRPPGQAQPPSPSPPQDPREADGRGQKALRRALGELMQRFGDLTGQVPAPLGEADMAMRDAGQALAEGRDAAAGAAQTKAIEALQKGGKEMGQQMARQFGAGKQPGEGEGEEGEGGDPGQVGEGGQDQSNRDGLSSGTPRPGEGAAPGRRRSARRDPMGRPLQQGTSGTDESGDVRVPDQMEQARTRAIQDELRRRGAERTRPQPELDYIDRLLKPF